MSARSLAALLLAAVCSLTAMADGAPDAWRNVAVGGGVERHVLRNAWLHYAFTPQLGGRGLAFSVPGQANLLKTGAAVRDDPDPVVSASGRNYPYLGHIVWVGPQRDWWRQQSLNPERRASGATWPPDPWTVLETYTLVAADETTAHLVAPPSPITGLQLTKRLMLEGDLLVHDVAAVNTRDADVTWDLWFNTRVDAQASVYVPVREPDGQFRLETFEGDPASADRERLRAGFFDFARDGRFRAKAFIQPAAGWMAVFSRGQLFVIEFDLQPADAIHRDHGQIELYIDTNPDSGLLELEVHAPLRTLPPGGRMSAAERWRAWPSGAVSFAEQRRELERRGYVISEWSARASR
ncbi:MAG: DUF4380 domain-containing protein [Xanthomonadales bacterium]